MTEPNAAVAQPVEKPASFFEDLIDIFFQPADVFRRRENASFWPVLVTVTLLITLFGIATANVLQPIYDAEWTRQMAAATKNGPAPNPELMAKIRGYTETATRYGAVVFVPIFVFVLAFIAWVVGKLFGSKQKYHAAVVVVAYAFVVRLIEAVVNGIQGLLMDPASLTGLTAIQIGPARFMDVASTNPLLLALLGRLNLFTLWVTVLLAVGIYVTGRVSRGQAIAFGVTMWVLGSLPALRSGYMAM